MEDRHMTQTRALEHIAIPRALLALYLCYLYITHFMTWQLLRQVIMYV